LTFVDKESSKAWYLILDLQHFILLASHLDAGDCCIDKRLRIGSA
jgi:hypothetical protein